MGERLDGRADQYALAATAFHLLTGSPPFRTPTPPWSSASTCPRRRPTIGDRAPSWRASTRCWPRPWRRTRRPLRAVRRLRPGIGPPAWVRRSTATVGTTSGRGGPPVQKPPRSADARRRHRACGAGGAPGGGNRIGCLNCVVPTTSRNRADGEIDDVTSADLHAAATAARAATVPRRRPSTATRHDTAAAAHRGDRRQLHPRGSTGTTADGSTAYCSTLQPSGTTIWSLKQGDIPSPTVTTEATERPLPHRGESPVRVCMQQTGTDPAAVPGGNPAQATDYVRGYEPQMCPTGWR